MCISEYMCWKAKDPIYKGVLSSRPHLILVSARVLEPIPHRHQGMIVQLKWGKVTSKVGLQGNCEPSGCSLALREARGPAVAALWRSAQVVELTLSRVNKDLRLPIAMWVNLEVDSLPVKLWNDCSPSPHLHCSLLRDLQPEASSWAEPGFLTHRNWEKIINAC